MFKLQRTELTTNWRHGDSVAAAKILIQIPFKGHIIIPNGGSRCESALKFLQLARDIN